jgi:hypothetical protein
MDWPRFICALFVACFWLLGPISPQLHFLLVQHSICDEHGELVEEAGSTEEHAGHRHDEPGVAVSSGDVPSDTHDHGCSFLASQLSPSQSSTAQLDTLPTVDYLPPLPLQSRTTQAPALDFAPKTSPPKA